MYGKNKIVWEIIGNRRKRMKKVRRIIILLLSFCLMMTMAGCSNEKKAQEKYDDKEFVKDMGKGLEARWDLNKKDEKKPGYKDILLQSKEYKEMMESYIAAELKYLKKYKNAKFKDSELQELAITYINYLNKSKKICKYIPVDYEGKYAEAAQSIYDGRSKIIEKMVSEYGLTVSKKYKETLDEFKTNSKLVKEEEDVKEKVDVMLKNAKFKMTSDDYGYKTYQAVITNNTGKDFESFSVDINLLDKKDVIIETMYDSLENFKNGAKARLQFQTNEKFTSTEMTASWQIK